MALATYTDLQASVASWLNRSDLSAVIPDFVSMAEAKHSRDLRLRKQVTSTTLSTVANTRGVSLPTDFLEIENISILGSPERQITYATVEQLDSVYPNSGTVAEPSLYTIEGDQILFGPTPDGAYSVSLLYYAKFPALASNSTNWLLTNHPSAYLYASLMYACMYLKDRIGVQEYRALYEQVAKDLQVQDDRAQHSGSTLRVRRV